MKNMGSLKKILVCTMYFVLTLVCIIGIYILISKTSNKENDSIVQAQDSNTYFRNVNPKFLIDFVNNEYIRFESVSSYSNPFENKKQSIWEKIKYTLGIKQGKRGVQISLIDVSYDTDLTKIMNEKDINIPKESLSKSFELTSSGRQIGSDSEEAVSKDTVISRNIYKGVDLEYQVIKGKGLKEEIVLNELPEYTTDCALGECSLPVNRFLFKIQLDKDLSIRRSIDGNSQYPTGTFYISDNDGNYFAHFLPEFAVDGVGYKTSNVVSNISLTDSGEYIYEVILDPEWLLSKERVFPIRIDPSIVHDSELVFNEGEYDRVQFDQKLTLNLNSDEYKSGTYTSSNLDLGQNNILNSITWQGYAQATGDGETPFSTLGLIYQENFDELVSFKKRWSSGALQLNNGDTKSLVIDSKESDNITMEFWSYKRYFSNEQIVFTSNLGSLKIKDGKYVFKDIGGVEYDTNIPIKYNTWQYIALVFNISNSGLSIYIDELEYVIDMGYSNETKLITLTFEGVGYIDTVRVYERLLAKNELLSNSQYSNIYFQYSNSVDGVSWDKWSTKSEYIPTPTIDEQYIEILSNDGNLNNYDTLSFEFLSDKQGSITLGTSKFSNGLDEQDIKRFDQTEGTLETLERLRYVDLLFTPSVSSNSCILALEGLEIYTLDTGRVGISIGEEKISTDDLYVLNEKNSLAISFLDTESLIYLNGNVIKGGVLSFIPTKYSVGSGCTNSINTFDGEITDIRTSIVQKKEAQILEYSKILDRTYLLKPMFKANLQSDTQIADINDIQFSISEMSFGALNHISNLNVGDSIVISEGDYSVEGVVTSLEQDTGLVTVEKWEDGGSVPQTGFSSSAQVLKWQSEYISTKDFLEIGEVVNLINMKYGSIQNIKNISIFSAFNSNDTIAMEQTDRYLRYRFIYVTSKYGVSSYLSGINIDYGSNGPSMDQVMRHGKWFNEGSKQTFWWSN